MSSARKDCAISLCVAPSRVLLGISTPSTESSPRHSIKMTELCVVLLLETGSHVGTMAVHSGFEFAEFKLPQPPSLWDYKYV